MVQDFNVTPGNMVKNYLTSRLPVIMALLILSASIMVLLGFTGVVFCDYGSVWSCFYRGLMYGLVIPLLQVCSFLILKFLLKKETLSVLQDVFCVVVVLVSILPLVLYLLFMIWALFNI